MVSIHNPRLKYVRRLANGRFREREKKFLVEGVRFVEEALAANWPVEMLVYTGKSAENPRAGKLLAIAASRNAVLLEVAEGVFTGLADTATPQGIMAVAAQRGYKPADLEPLKDPALLVLVDGVQDPGNLGAIVRSADAAGAGGVILCKGTADLYNPKTLRATMGSIFHLPVLQGVETCEIISYLNRRGVKIIAGDPRAKKVLYEIDFRIPCVLAVGSEAAGIGALLKEGVNETARIPMPGRAESLNVAISVSIMLYEVSRQRGAR